jgi:hypothetical protein
MSCCLAGADDATDAFVAHDGYNKQDSRAFHAQAQDALFAIVESVIDQFELAGILESPDCGREAHTMLRQIRCGLGLIPLIVDEPDTTGYR